MKELGIGRMKRSRVPVGVIRMDYYILPGRRCGKDNGELLGCDGGGGMINAVIHCHNREVTAAEC